MTNAAVNIQNETSRIDRVFNAQRIASRKSPYPTLRERLEALDKIDRLLINNQDAICEAVNADYGNRSSQETRLLEVSQMLSSVAYNKKHLKKWMAPEKRHVGISFLGAKNKVIPQPKGVVGVVSPWNYPLGLAIGPAIAALAAGNRVIVKMAANSQNLCRLLDKLVSAEFSEDQFAVIPGVSAGEFTDRPWDHFVFTGSPATGKVVMETASKYLTPVTLELGGKSPTIVAKDFNLRTAAERLLFGKFINCGQTCTAPDYLFLPRESVDEFVKHAKDVLNERYGSSDSGDLTSLIDNKAFERISYTVKDATEKGAEVIQLVKDGAPNPETRKFPPSVVLNVKEDMVIMQDEIFGPLLPIKVYDSIDDVIEYINAGERPLALYLFTNDKKLQDKVVYNTLSGGVSINDTLLHVAQHDMPFGGVGNSGMGHYHGKEGFIEFSKIRPVFKQAKQSGILMLAPPYGPRFEKLMNLMIKFRL
ncbi:putative coniferyl aldehyde dehydrogenase [Marinobacterium nitratireducens]|uniref:Aldehyde dehydrogenase n=1 Tax=Marinobacterium nitratireducens TaxID=518897 RepID=A0A917Z9K2_9GAMM|nr:coniferyl aldehyde dehydrogenase [Marinobacterium nitratireducens]GGO78979.1 putative coniferyl aldehyde dehydrogenase [Marinobacterium nitratireducens]